MSLFESTQHALDQAIAALSRTMALKSYRRLALNFLVLAVNLAIIILYFALSQAKIIIVPKTEILTDEINFLIANDGQILEKAVELERPFAVPDVESQPTQAEGIITIANATPSREQLLVENTQFINEDGEIIRTRERVVLSPGQTAAIPAYSPELGKEVRLGRYQILKLPYLRDKIYGEVTEQFTSRQQQVKIITKEFYNSVFEGTIFSMQAQAGEEWAAEGYQFGDIRDIEVILNKMERDAQIGDTGKDFLLVKAGGLARLVIFDRRRALTAAQDEFSRNLAADKKLVEFLENETEFVPVAEERLVLVKIKAKVADKINYGGLNKKELIGKKRDEVERYLKEKFARSDIQVKFSPFWVRSVPRLEDHVDIEIR